MLPDAELDRAILALERAQGQRGMPAYRFSDLALLYQLRFSAGSASEAAAQELLSASVAAQEAGLAQAPADNAGWARLAYARYQRAGFDAATRDALEMSLLTRGLGLSLLSFRLQLILREWELAGPELQAAAQAEILQFLRHGGHGYEALVDAYLVSPRSEIIDAVLAESPAQQAEFARRLERRSRSR